ncbi:MAG: Rieske 2Fe-2S domain-containing protein, partial [Myxococcota bacterium]
MYEYGWVAIASSDEIRAGKVTGLRRMGRELVVWRDRRGDAQ